MLTSIRTTFFLFLFSVCTIFCMSYQAQAADSEAKLHLEKTINEVLFELERPDFKNPANRQVILDKIEAIILRLFDFNELSMRTVGASWKKFTPDQQKRFQDAFTTLLRETYLERLTHYNGETVLYTGEVSSTKGDKVEIKTIIPTDENDIPVSYRMLKKRSWVVYDVNIEGVSMVQNYRTQFQEMLAKGDIESLIQQVGAKAQETKARNAK